MSGRPGQDPGDVQSDDRYAVLTPEAGYDALAGDAAARDGRVHEPTIAKLAYDRVHKGYCPNPGRGHPPGPPASPKERPPPGGRPFSLAHGAHDGPWGAIPHPMGTMGHAMDPMMGRG